MHFLDLYNTPDDLLRRIFDRGFALRELRRRGVSAREVLEGKTLALVFEKPSLRTRVSFEQGMAELGGRAIVLDSDNVGQSLGEREPVKDVARVLSSMVDGIAARVFAHEKLVEMAEFSGKPVINMLSDASHPCQALADAMTIMDEFGRDLKSPAGHALRVGFVGDGNNVAASLAEMCGKLGMAFGIASPGGYELPQAVVDRVMGHCPDMDLSMSGEPGEVARHADVLVTDTFVSMGQEGEKHERIAAFKGFQINDALLAKAPEHAIVLHCMPAYRGLEITESVMEGPRSRVFAEAENRLHAQKGLLAVLMGD